MTTPENLFEACHEPYEHCQIVLENKVPTIRVDEHAKYLRYFREPTNGITVPEK